MAIKIRLARGGSKKRPFYRVVAADSRMPRDGRFIEKLGTYNPQLPKDSEDRVKLDVEKIQEWISKGAQPTDRVARFLEAAGVREKANRANMKKAEPGKKAVERAKERAEKEAAIAEARAELVGTLGARDAVLDAADALSVAADGSPAPARALAACVRSPRACGAAARSTSGRSTPTARSAR